MWWEPHSEDERRLAEILPRLEKRYLDQRRRELVLGVGAYFSQERLRPMLLLNSLVPPLLSWLPYSVGSEALPANVSEELLGWELPSDTIFFMTSPPEPVATPFGGGLGSGAAIRCQKTHTRATFGVALRFKGQAAPAFLTVGHVAPLGPGSIIELIERSYFGKTKFRPIGSVIDCVTPTISAGQPEYDAAIVGLTSPRSLRSLRHKGVARIRSPLTQPLLATLHGGVSGIVGPAGLVGSLNAYGGLSGVWKNSWLVQPSGLISQGDSGGILVLNATQTLAGMIVGGSRLPTSNVYMAQYAHDIEALDRDFLAPRGFSLS